MGGAEGVDEAFILDRAGGRPVDRDRLVAGLDRRLGPVMARGLVEVAEDERRAGPVGLGEVLPEQLDPGSAGALGEADRLGLRIDERRAAIGNVEQLVGLIGRVVEVDVERVDGVAIDVDLDPEVVRGRLTDLIAAEDRVRPQRVVGLGLLVVVEAEGVGQLVGDAVAARGAESGRAPGPLELGLLDTDDVGVDRLDRSDRSGRSACPRSGRRPRC